MAWWNRRRSTVPGPGGGTVRGRTDGPAMEIDHASVRAHCEQFVRSRRGVEGYIEPATSVTATTIVLIASDGEWTRRAVGSPRAGFQLGRALGIPVYDVNQTGYPARMREWNRRNRR